MQLRSTVPSHHSNMLLWAIAVLGVALLSLLPLTLLDGGPSSGGSGVARSQRIAYLEFGTNADTLWLADANNPSKRQRGLTLSHAPEFGIVPSLSPDRKTFAYNLLPPGARPAPETPAELWLAQTASNDKPQRLAENIDLLVPAVWSTDGKSLVFRRSGDFRLFAFDIATKSERELVAGEGSALFPVGFSADNTSIFYVRMTSDDSSLYAYDIASQAPRVLGTLSQGLTRDWKLSPTRDRLAYLAMTLDQSRASSTAYVFDMATGVAAKVATPGDAFSPAWNTAGEVAFGTIGSSGRPGGVILQSTTGGSTITAPAGFDVPLGFAPESNSLVVRNFDGASAVNPGRERLELVSPDGTRKTITNDEVTFLGWIDP